MRLRGLAIGLLLLAVSGCGSGGSEDNARRSVERFLAALERHDGRAACRELAPETASAVARDEMRPCGEAILSLGISPAPIRGCAGVRGRGSGQARGRGRRLPRRDERGLAGQRRRLPARAGQALRLRAGGLMGAVFIFTLVLIASGLVYFTLLGLMHQ